MKQTEKLFQILTRFLRGKESTTEKQETIHWYDQMSSSVEADKDTEDKVKQQAKVRIMKDISTRRPALLRSIIWSASAAAVLIVAFIGIRYVTQQPQEEPATTELLATIAPAQERAVITLEDGTRIDLDSLGIDQQVQVGNIIIKKDAEGQVSYENIRTGEEEVQINSLTVPKASTYKFTLEDGTQVTLNAGTKLSYPSSFGAGDRVVQLEGEAYFDVQHTHDNSRFIVVTDQQEITVLGTKFNVKAHTDEEQTRTSLAEGLVSVSNSSLTDQHVILKPHQQAISGTQGRLQTKNINIDDVLGWTRGQFCFDGSNASEVLQEIARWYDIDVHYEKNKTWDQYIGKIPRNLSLDKLIELFNYADLQTKAVVGKNKRINLIIT